MGPSVNWGGLTRGPPQLKVGGYRWSGDESKARVGNSLRKTLGLKPDFSPRDFPARRVIVRAG